MPKREGWIKLDRRLVDHHKVRRLAKALNIPRWCVIGALAYLWGLAEDVGPCLGDFDPADHEELPDDLLPQMEAVGWAHRDEAGGWCVSTREENPRTLEMRALAQQRWNRNAEPMRPHADRNAGSMRPHTRRSAREREREKERQTDAACAAAVPASSPEGSLGPADVIAQLRAMA